MGFIVVLVHRLLYGFRTIIKVHILLVGQQVAFGLQMYDGFHIYGLVSQGSIGLGIHISAHIILVLKLKFSLPSENNNIHMTKTNKKI